MISLYEKFGVNLHEKMGGNCNTNTFSFNLFIYDLDKDVYEFYTNRKFEGTDIKEAVSNAVRWIEKSFSHFESLEWVIETKNVESQCHFFINDIPIDKYISAYNKIKQI